MNARDLAQVAAFAALIAVFGLIGPLYPLGLAVPITAQTLGVMLAGSILGARRGAAAAALFLALVAIGMPWLAGGRGGLGVFAGPSAGFLIGWIFGAAVIGLLVARRPRLPRMGDLGWLIAANVLGGIVVIYTVGVPVLAWRTQVPLGTALIGSTVFLPGDLIKALIAALIAQGVFRGYPVVLNRQQQKQSQRQA